MFHWRDLRCFTGEICGVSLEGFAVFCRRDLQ